MALPLTPAAPAGSRPLPPSFPAAPLPPPSSLLLIGFGAPDASTLWSLQPRLFRAPRARGTQALGGRGTREGLSRAGHTWVGGVVVARQEGLAGAWVGHTSSFLPPPPSFLLLPPPSSHEYC